MLREFWLCLIVVAGLIDPCPAQEGPGEGRAVQKTEQLGRQLFKQSCGVCHTKPTLVSPLFGPQLSKQSLGGSADAMREVISNGTPRMPGFKYHFQPSQIDAIVAYLQTVAKLEPEAPAPAASPLREQDN